MDSWRFAGLACPFPRASGRASRVPGAKPDWMTISYRYLRTRSSQAGYSTKWRLGPRPPPGAHPPGVLGVQTGLITAYAPYKVCLGFNCSYRARFLVGW